MISYFLGSAHEFKKCPRQSYENFMFLNTIHSNFTELCHIIPGQVPRSLPVISGFHDGYIILTHQWHVNFSVTMYLIAEYWSLLMWPTSVCGNLPSACLSLQALVAAMHYQFVLLCPSIYELSQMTLLELYENHHGSFSKLFFMDQTNHCSMCDIHQGVPHMI